MLFRFQIDLSDVDRGVYETLDLRTAQHPSETKDYLLSRILAYALAYRPGMEFSPSGLGDPDQPAIRAMGMHGSIDLWIDIGNPAPKRLHKASKAAREVMVFTYKNPELLLASIAGEEVHRASELNIRALPPQFLEQLPLEKNNRWTLLHQQGRLDVGIGEQTISGEILTVRP